MDRRHEIWNKGFILNRKKVYWIWNKGLLLKQMKDYGVWNKGFFFEAEEGLLNLK
jgi:hypothetical protein